jgi:hypothetical protein
VDTGKERYGLTWPGKADWFKTIQAPSLGTLRPAPEESVNFDTTENLIIEGDNLEGQLRGDPSDVSARQWTRSFSEDNFLASIAWEKRHTRSGPPASLFSPPSPAVHPPCRERGLDHTLNRRLALW